MFSLPSLRRHFRFRSFNPSSVVSMAFDSTHNQKAIVRIKQDDANLTIALTVVGKSRILNRPKTEPLGRSLERLRLSISNPKRKNKKRKEEKEEGQSNSVSNDTEIQTTVALYASDSKENPLSEILSNEQAWSMGKCLIAGSTEYKVIVNPPTVEKLEMKDKILVGHPIFPLCTLAFAEEESCQWKWYRQNPTSNEFVELVSENRIYTPSIDEVGSYLQVQCIPVSTESSIYTDLVSSQRTGEPYELKLGPVEKAPRAASSQGRDILTNQLTQSPVFRILSYNILAGAYTSRQNAIEIIFKYCNPKYLDIDYRKQLILKEILRYNADILCLQEVDTRVFETYLKIHMKHNGDYNPKSQSLQSVSLGFDGVFNQKSITTREGSATFVRRSRFTIVAHHALVLNKVLDSKLPTYLEPFQEMINSSENMRNALKAVGTIAQITIVESVQSGDSSPAASLCIINTHLLSNPFAEHIRLLHVICILNEAKKLITSFGRNAQVIFTGDLNSSVENGVLDGSVQLLRDNCINSDHWEWKECGKFEWRQTGEDEESGIEEDRSTRGVIDPIKGIDLVSPLHLQSAMSLDTPWTNYTDLFKGLLDYIWYEPKQLELERTIPLPTEEQLEGPIPSDVYPSDHLAVIAELKFQSVGRIRRAELSNIALGVDALESGEIIGVPTDTIYGFAANAADSNAIHKLYTIKGRSLKIPLAVCVADSQSIQSFCEVDHLPSSLLSSLLPGSVTIVLSRKESSVLSVQLNPGLVTIGIRVPDCEFLRHLCDKFGQPIALTSANSSGEMSSTSVEHFRHLWNSCCWIFDAGEVSSSFLGSTVIDLTQSGAFKIIRKGDGLDGVLKILHSFNFLELS